MTRWSGHLPITRVALFSIVVRAAADECEFSRDERLLFVASEFWAAVSANELRAHLGSQALERLRTAGIAMGSLGAVDLANTIFEGVDELSAMNSRKQRSAYLERLEHQLQTTQDSVDVLIALISQRCLSVAMPGRPFATGATLH